MTDAKKLTGTCCSRDYSHTTHQD